MGSWSIQKIKVIRHMITTLGIYTPNFLKGKIEKLEAIPAKLAKWYVLLVLGVICRGVSYIIPE